MRRSSFTLLSSMSPMVGSNNKRRQIPSKKATRTLALKKNLRRSSKLDTLPQTLQNNSLVIINDDTEELQSDDLIAQYDHLLSDSRVAEITDWVRDVNLATNILSDEILSEKSRKFVTERRKNLRRQSDSVLSSLSSLKIDSSVNNSNKSDKDSSCIIISSSSVSATKQSLCSDVVVIESSFNETEYKGVIQSEPRKKPVAIKCREPPKTEGKQVLKQPEPVWSGILKNLCDSDTTNSSLKFNNTNTSDKQKKPEPIKTQARKKLYFDEIIDALTKNKENRIMSEDCKINKANSDRDNLFDNDNLFDKVNLCDGDNLFDDLKKKSKTKITVSNNVPLTNNDNLFNIKKKSKPGSDSTKVRGKCKINDGKSQLNGEKYFNDIIEALNKKYSNKDTQPNKETIEFDLFNKSQITGNNVRNQNGLNIYNNEKINKKRTEDFKNAYREKELIDSSSDDDDDLNSHKPIRSKYFNDDVSSDRLEDKLRSKCLNPDVRELTKEKDTLVNDLKDDKHKTFLESLSGCVAILDCHPKARKYRHEYQAHKTELATKLFHLFNEKVFDNRIPLDTPIDWSERMRWTAGYCYCKRIVRSTTLVERNARIVLSSKVLDSPDRLRDTLIHELCHAAAWILHEVRNGHGEYWKKWTMWARKAFPELPPITKCHDYVVNTKYTYRCTNCGYSIGRHSKSLDLKSKRCGYCMGKFELLINKKSKNGDVKAVPVTPRKEPSAFALFVKDNYGIVKTPQLNHGQVMKLLGQKFHELKV